MKIRLSQRAALALGLPAVARDLGRARRWRLALLAQASDKLNCGRLLGAAALFTLYLAGL